METEEQTPSETEEGFDDFTSDGKSETEDESGITSSDNADFFSEGSTENTDSLSDKILMKMASFLKKMEAQK